LLVLRLALVCRLGNCVPVLLHVAHQIVFLNKRFSTGATDKVLLRVVTPFVTNQVSLAHEVFAADITTERSLLLVGPLVEKEIALQRKRFSTFGA